MKKYIYIFVLFLLSNYCVAQEGVVPHATIGKITIEKHYQQDMPILLEAEPFSLLSDSGSLMHDLSLQFSVLSDNQLALMPGDMVNVMGELANGYRLLPSGEHFAKPAVITLPYDPYRIPTGYHPTDIYTYYYDDDIAHWKQLERAYVDTVAHTISSYTTHFTDYANAVIKVPEMPESKAYVPTEMSDQPDVNPLQGIPMVAAPTANNKGTAELSYPIELPAGRLGMQPNVDLHYSSASGNGVLGVGWTLNISAISVDTRWGVPRFDPRYESESYLLDGEQLVLHDGSGQALPLPHQITTGQFRNRSVGETEYYARNTKNQDRVVRYGATMSNTYWVVTDRSGTKRYYGFDPITQCIQDNAVVRSNGAIAYWALTAVVDMSGNYIHYEYSKENNDVKISTIVYTGSIGSKPALPNYRVQMQYQYRSDSTNNGRLGVLQSQTKLLSCIIVSTTTGEPIRNYKLEYEISSASLNKSRLVRIVKVDSPNTCGCGAPYIKNDKDSVDVMIENDSELSDAIKILSMTDLKEDNPGSETLFRYQDAVPHDRIYSDSTSVNLPAINQSTNYQWGVGGTVSVGLGPNPALTTMSLGGNYNYQQSSGSVKSMIMDIDGDGLSDYVYENHGNIFYYKQNADGTFGENPIQIVGIHALSREVTSTHNFGLQGSVRPGIEYFSFGADISYSPQYTTSYTDVYFTDVNSDGLPDLVTPNGVMVNTLQNGIPNFAPIPNSRRIVVNNSCCGVVSRDGSVDMELECQKKWEYVTAVTWNSTLKSSQSGTTDIVNKEGNELQEPMYVYAYDTIHEPEGPLSIYPDFPADQWIDGSSLTEMSWPVSPIENGDAMVYTQELAPEWYGPDYLIVPTNDSLYIYHLETTCSDSSTIPNVDIVRVWVAPYEGDIDLISSIRLIKDTTESRIYATKADGVQYCIQHNSSMLRPMSIIAADDTLIHSSTEHLHVNEHDVLLFRLSANSDRRFDDTEWTQRIVYQDREEHFSSNLDYVCTEEKCFTAPSDGWAKFRYKYSIDYLTAPVIVSVMRNGNTVLHRDTFITASSGEYTSGEIYIQKDSTISFVLSYPNNEPKWSAIHVFPTVQFTFDSNSGMASISDTLNYNPDIEILCSSIIENPEDSLRLLFGKLHRGWGQFAYRAERDTDIIDLSELYNSEKLSLSELQNDTLFVSNALSQIDTNALSDLSSNSSVLGVIDSFNPLGSQNKWIPMHANSVTEEWEAYGKLGRLGRVLHSTSMPTLSTTIDSVCTVEYDSPIPNVSSSGYIDFVRKKSTSEQRSMSAGAGANVGDLSLGTDKNSSWGSSTVDVDYMDMNGDGFPDFVGRNIQYSHPWGGMGLVSTPSNIGLSQSTNESNGIGMSGSINVWQKIVSNDIKKQAGYNSSIGGGESESSTNYSFVDINADGLPDYIDLDHQQVCYNLGYSFSDPSPLDSNFKILQGSSANASLGISGSFTINQNSISGGVSHSQSFNATKYKVVDVDGDGWLDIVCSDNGRMYVLWGLSDNSYSARDTLGNISLNSLTTNESLNLSLTLGFTVLGVVKFCVGIQGSPFGISNTSVSEEMMDINSDGYVDIVHVTGNGSSSVKYNQNGYRPVNMLTQVTNPTGQVLHFDYAITTPSVEKRTRTWNLVRVMDEIANNQGVPHLLTTEISYENPYYDNYEKTDYGYAKVTSNINNKKIIVEEYDNANYISRGEKLGDLLMDVDSVPYIGHRHEVRYMDQHQRVSDSYCDDANLYTARDGYWTDYYDHDTTPSVVTYYTRDYDRYYNMVLHSDMGDISDPDDDWNQVITYSPSIRWNYNLISLPVDERITDAHGDCLRRSEASYNAYGRPKWVRRWQTDTTFAQTDLYYNVYGNVSFAYLPYTSDSILRPWRRYLYDAVTKTYPIFSENQFAERYYTGYDLRWGLPVVKLDPIGNPILYRYDNSGRLTELTAPREWKQNRPATWLYRYANDAHDISIPPSNRSNILCVGQVASSENVTDVSCCLYDQRGKLIQKKQRKEVGGNDEWVVDAVRVYDSFYNLLAQTQPFVSNANVGDPDLDYTRPFSYISEYDVLDRPDTIINYDGSIRTYRYDFEQDYNGITRLRTQCTDENGVKTRQYKNPQEWVLQETDGIGESVQYTYNPLGERISAQDADGYRTTYSYDQLGNCVERIHPDAGVTRWTYAPYGNLISQQTAELEQQGLTIDYQYWYDRLEEVHYPTRIDKNVNYHYDAAGRVLSRHDGCGSETYDYDELGNISSSYRRIILPTEDSTYEFHTRYHYDSFGRVRWIVYPDQDSVIYNYSRSGALKSVFHCVANGMETPIVKNITYDEQGRRTYQLFGNDVQSEYTYHPLTQRLTDVMTTVPGDLVIQELHYDYDSVGNIVALRQHAPQCGGLGGAYDCHYTYDDNYRLVSALDSTGVFPFTYNGNYSPAGRQDFNHLYTPIWAKKLSYFYDATKHTHQPRIVLDEPIGEQTSLIWDRNGNLIAGLSCQKKNGYRFHFWDEDNCLSAVVGPTRAGIYGYDGNGVRVWKMAGTCAFSQKNASQLDCDVSLDKLTVYPNPYMVIYPGGYTKRYFNGTEHLATSVVSCNLGAISKMGLTEMDDLEFNRIQQVTKNAFNYLSTSIVLKGEDEYEDIHGNTKSGDCSYSEDVDIHLGWTQNMLKTVKVLKSRAEMMYVHPNHLGSASWITDKTGFPVQYLHYAPYGELLANQQAYTYDERYKFTGKERDWESGYDYVEARFLWSDVGTWLSVDPLVDKYLWITPYAYCAWNPIKYVDPNGRGPKDRVLLAQNLVNMRIPYLQEINSAPEFLRTGTTPEAMANMDCSEFVCRVMAGDGITPQIESHSTRDLLQNVMSDENRFVKSDIPISGDIVLWNGHTGVIENYNEKTQKVTVLHSTRYGENSNGDGTKSYKVSSTCRENYSLKYYKNHQASFYRPVNETPDVLEDCPSVKLSEITIKPSLAND